jgi:hypothetical protein
MEQIKIVVRYADGRVVKGYSSNFLPNRPSFHLTPYSAESGNGAIDVSLKDLKALFFVKDFAGDSSRKDEHKIAEDKKPAGRMVEVMFNDGEVLVGTTTGYDPNRSGFFLFPVYPESNNIRVFILSGFVKQVRFI